MIPWVLTMNKDITAYAMEYVSFLADNLDEADMKNIRDIVLFGSVARGTGDRESDVDIFVNVMKEGKIEGKIDKLTDKFYGTEACRKWRLRGIKNDINVITGRLEKWKDLKISVLDDGISLYSKYTGIAGGAQSVIIFWDNVKQESKRVMLSKKLYGYNYKKTRSRGLVELTGSTKLGANCIITDPGSSKKMLEVFKDLGVTPKTMLVERI